MCTVCQSLWTCTAEANQLSKQTSRKQAMPLMQACTCADKLFTFESLNTHGKYWILKKFHLLLQLKELACLKMNPQRFSFSLNPLSANKERGFYLSYLRNLLLSPKLADALSTINIQILNHQEIPMTVSNSNTMWRLTGGTIAPCLKFSCFQNTAASL